MKFNFEKKKKKEYHISGEVLKYINDDWLTELNIVNLEKRKAFKALIAELYGGIDNSPLNDQCLELLRKNFALADELDLIRKSNIQKEKRIASLSI